MTYLISFILLITAVTLKSIRWKLILPESKKIRFSNIFPAICIGLLMNLIFPLRIGDIFRVLILRLIGRSNLSISSITTSVIHELFIDSLFLIFIVISLIIFLNLGFSILINFFIYFYIIIFFIIFLISFKKSSFVKIATHGFISIFNNQISKTLKRLIWETHEGYSTNRVWSVKYLTLTMLLWIFLISFYLSLMKVQLNFANIWQSIIQFHGNIYYSFLDILNETENKANLIDIYNSQFLFYLTISLISVLIFLLRTNIILNKFNSDKNQIIFPILLRKNLYNLPTFESHKVENEFLDQWFLNSKPFRHEQGNKIIDFFPGGSGARILLMENKNNQLFVRKESFTFDLNKKLEEQVNWYKHNVYFKSPKIYSHTTKLNEHSYYYDMGYLGDCLPMYKIVNLITIDQSMTLLNKVLDKIFYDQKNINNNIEVDFANYFELKILNNLKIVESCLIEILPKKICKFNGIELSLDNLNIILEIKDKIKFLSSKINNFHGDLTFENILVDPSLEIFYIDPNPSYEFNFNMIDASKLSQSLNLGYEFLNNSRLIKHEGNSFSYKNTLSTIYKKLYNRLETRIRTDYGYNYLIVMKFHEIVNYLRLIPYKSNNNQKLLFCLCLLKLCSDLKIEVKKYDF